MTLLLCIFCFVFASIYSSSTAQEVQVCVSYGGPELGELFINVNWNFTDDKVNIMFEDNEGITSGVYNKSSAVDIPLRLKVDQDTVNVTVCRLNNPSCYSVITVTDPIHNATWTRVNDTTLEFTCEVACRTPAITGCHVRLVDNSDMSNEVSSTLFNVNGSDEDISSHFVTVLVTDVDPTVEWTFTATPVAIVNRVGISLNGFMGIIPAAVKGQEVQVCVSYGGPVLAELFINVNWNFLDNEVNIMFEDNDGITSGVYNQSSAVDIPFRLKVDQETINVTVCRLNNTLCYSVITVTDPIYNATWTRVNDTTLEFTCEVACRTPDITGCHVHLVDNNDSSNSVFGTSYNINGSDEDISSRFVSVLVTNVDPTIEWTCTVFPIAILNKTSISLSNFKDIIPAAVQVVETTTRVLPSSTKVSTCSVLSTQTTSSSITPKNTPNTPTSYESSSSLSTAAVVITTVLITMVISIALTTIVMLFIFKLYLLKRSQHTQHPPKTEVPTLKVKDIKEESNPAYEITENNDSNGYDDLYY